MRIALLGYGKMGKAIEEIAISRGHSIGLKVTSANKDYSSDDLKNHDVAIEFSRPELCEENINKCFAANVPIIVGTTGWYNQFEKIEKECLSQNQALFHATNFSVGVNLFFELNTHLAKLMNGYSDYDVSMTEIHHTQKLDSPSGTAITLAEGVLKNLDRKNGWVEGSSQSNELEIKALREPNIPGTHILKYENNIDIIEIKHEAKNRKGFATGAVLAAEWIIGKKGVFTMKNMLSL